MTQTEIEQVDLHEEGSHPQNINADAEVEAEEDEDVLNGPLLIEQLEGNGINASDIKN